jgi:Cu-processing system permease protein
MIGIIGLAGAEFRIATRNRWVTIVIAIMVLFSLVLSAVGSAPTGALGSDSLSVTVASLTGLAVYLVPLVALLMSFDAVAGEVERGTLPLMLTYPVSRAGVLLGKFLAHLSILAVALVISAFGRHVPRDRLRRIGLCPASWCRCRAGHRRLACSDRSIRPRPAGRRRG